MGLFGIIKAILLVVVAYRVLDVIPLDSFFLMDPQELHAIAKKAVAFETRNTTERIDYLMGLLREKYPGRMATKQEWFFNNAGGAMGSLTIIHASITEYLIVFGSAVGTEGHSGRYLATDYFMILEGEQWAQRAHEMDKVRFLPGELNVLPKGEAIQYKMPDRCWALEYARGWIPLMLPFGVADTLTSTLDFHTLSRMMFLYGRHVVSNLLTGKI